MTQPGQPTRIGILGCGAIARRHVKELAAVPGAQIAICCDKSLDAARRLRTEFQLTQAETHDEDGLFSAATLDAVLICSPTTDHYRQAARALAQGLHVLCEKPLALERKHILDLTQRSRDSKRVLCVAFQRRYEPVFLTARRELTERRDIYGPIREVHLHVCERWQQSIRGTWRDDPAVGAGYFGDAGSHQIDACSFISQLRVESVLAWSDCRDSRVEIVTRALARLSGGAGLTAHFVGDANHWREDLHFFCERADLLIRNGQVLRCCDNRVEPIQPLAAGSTPAAAFVSAIRQGEPTNSPPECALAVFDWTMAVLRSKTTGAWTSLSD